MPCCLLFSRSLSLADFVMFVDVEVAEAVGEEGVNDRTWLDGSLLAVAKLFALVLAESDSDSSVLPLSLLSLLCLSRASRCACRSGCERLTLPDVEGPESLMLLGPGDGRL